MINLKIRKIGRSEKNLSDVKALIRKHKWEGSVFEYPVDFLGAELYFDFDKNILVGMTLGWRIDNKKWNLDKVEVNKKYRRSGYGGAIIKNLLDRLLKRGYTFIGIMSRDNSSNQFYTRLGFKKINQNFFVANKSLMVKIVKKAK